MEPAEGQIKQFNEKVSNTKFLNHVSFEYHQISCEEFYKSYKDRKFHLVLMIHVMYYIEDYKEVIKIYTDMLYEGGTLLILQENESRYFFLMQGNYSECVLMIIFLFKLQLPL